MHFSIPDTQDFYNERNGTSYTGYNIHINGIFHCCLRYKQLHNFNEQLKKRIAHIIPTKLSNSYSKLQFGNESCADSNATAATVGPNGKQHYKKICIRLPEFPPKKLLPLSQSQLEIRRYALERYIQLLGQDPIISKTDMLFTFLLNAQQESAGIEQRTTTLETYLMNGYRIEINCLTTDASSKILEIACQNIGLPNEMIHYFSLYLMRKENDDNIALVRKLMDFESPYISQRLLSDCQIVIRKCYWDPCYDIQLMQDKIALNLLYIQTVSDIEKDWIIVSPDIKAQLRSLQDRGNKKEYLDIARKLPSYGCIQFSKASVDYPEPNTCANIVVGNSELSIRITDGLKIQETKFKVTRMRCWRVTTTHNVDDSQDIPSNSTKEFISQSLELSFEYLMNKDSLRWIVINSENAMLMSVCLQGMVDELINQKEGNHFTNIKIQTDDYIPFLYIKRDDSNRISDSSSSDTISSLNEIDMQTTGGESFSMKRKIKNKISTTVFFTKGRESVFEEIGDDDL
ncbi:sorting nexin-17 [Condylostylus longicornis]|uniref:sorting nexin-17 n=1 Tax=Condylostylus longicornis TaxID=2530218 RepID=UPI00244DC5B8|nr:sorting nexin-17 [Condylostylus longicornis]